MNRPCDRRDFLKATMAAGSGVTLAPRVSPSAQAAGPRDAPAPIPLKPRETLRVGFVGVGARGGDLVHQFLRCDGVEIKAVCDIVPERVKGIQDLAGKHGRPAPAGYSKDEVDYRRMCEKEDLDLVVNATPWQLHTKVCLAALNNGKHAATEVPAALTVEECWQQVEASEKNQRHCMILENYCYQRDVMMVMSLVRQGLFGHVMHAEGGYQKDARYYDIQFQPDGSLTWQGQFRKNHHGNIYPTHDIGPISWWLDINRGDRFDYVVSIGSAAHAFNEYGAAYQGPDHYLTRTRWDMSDINVCLIKTVQGKSIYLILDTLLGRPDHRNVYRLLGSKGIYDRTIHSLYLEGKSPRHDRWNGQWEPVDKYYKDHDHPLWKSLLDKTKGSGHGGGDFLCVYRVVQALRTGTPPDMDVYDNAAWSAIVDLTQQSAQNRSRPVDFPDFTRGAWQTRRPVPIAG